MSAILLDSHIVVWSRTEPHRLSNEQRLTLEQLERTGQTVAISDITFWELSLAFEKGRLTLDVALDEYLHEIEGHPLVEVLPINARIAAEAARLGRDFHKDPCDRIIVATARVHGMRLMTADTLIRRWGKIPLI